MILFKNTHCHAKFNFQKSTKIRNKYKLQRFLNNNNYVFLRQRQCMYSAAINSIFVNEKPNNKYNLYYTK